MKELHADSITKAFGDNVVLTDVHLRCQPGEIIGLLGRNGSGKSTMLKIIFGSLSADTRFVRIDGLYHRGLQDNLGKLAYLPQNNFLPKHLIIKKILELYCDKDSVKLLSEMKIFQEAGSKKSSELSGGEQRLIEVILLIYSNSSYVFLDEPFNGIAPFYKDEIKRMIVSQSKTKGFVITDHDYRNVLDVATKIVLMHDGGTKVIDDKEKLKFWNYIPE